MIEESFNKRLIIDSQEYDYEGSDQYGKVYLSSTRTKEQLVLPNSEY